MSCATTISSVLNELEAKLFTNMFNEIKSLFESIHELVDIHLKCPKNSIHAESNETHRCEEIIEVTNSAKLSHQCSEKMCTIHTLNINEKDQGLSKGHTENQLDVTSFSTMKIENLEISNTSVLDIVEAQNTIATKASSSIALGVQRKYSKDPHPCEKCNHISKGRMKHILHNWEVHDNNISGRVLPIYRCEKCKYETKRKASFDSHCRLKVCTKRLMAKTNYRCEKCKYETKRKDNYDRHCRRIQCNKSRMAINVPKIERNTSLSITQSKS